MMSYHNTSRRHNLEEFDLNLYLHENQKLRKCILCSRSECGVAQDYAVKHLNLYTETSGDQCLMTSLHMMINYIISIKGKLKLSL